MNLTSEEVNPRFSQTYEYNPATIPTDDKKEVHYAEIPSYENLWMLDIILQKHEFLGLIGNAYQHPNGYSDYKVLLPEEINEPYLEKEELLNMAFNTVSMMSTEEFNQFEHNNSHLKMANPTIFKFLSFLNKNPE